MSFKVGDIVTWTSQAQAHTKTKTGEIMEILPAGQRPNRNKYPNLYSGVYGQPSFRGVGGARKHESYVVKVDKKFYWPLVSKLTGSRLHGEQTELDLGLTSTYTVVGFYLDNDQTWVQAAKGKDAREAAKNAVRALAGVPDKDQVTDSEDQSAVEVVAVFKGDHKDCLGLTEVTNSEDL